MNTGLLYQSVQRLETPDKPRCHQELETTAVRSQPPSYVTRRPWDPGWLELFEIASPSNARHFVRTPQHQLPRRQSRQRPAKACRHQGMPALKPRLQPTTGSGVRSFDLMYWSESSQEHCKRHGRHLLASVSSPNCFSLAPPN